VTGVVVIDEWFPVPVPDNVIMADTAFLYSAYAFMHMRSQQPVAVRVGDHSGIHEYCQFVLGPAGAVEIGDHSTIVSTTFSTNGRVVIGDCVMFGYGVVIADDPVAVPGSTASPETVTIGDNTWIGARSVLLPGADIGHDSVIGAGSVVDFAVPAGVMVAGQPARVVSDLRR
jgi:acetyltransferase-like isoleucine patch superfamily enzyme